MTTLTYTGNLVVTSCWCGIHVGIPDDLEGNARRKGEAFSGIYCPLGHTFIYPGETEAEKYQRLYRQAEDRAAAERARADGAEASRRAWKGQATKARNRAAQGQCPFCGKYLVDLDLHVTRKHPDEHVRDMTEADLG